MWSKTATSEPAEPLEKRFIRFAKALMAVSKKEPDKELAKDERRKEQKKARSKS